MSRIKGLMVILLSVLRSAVGGDVEVSCVFMGSCILPCSLQVNGEVIIHWIQLKAGQTPVLSYYSNQDQLANQDQRFKNRTSLFKDQISRGNASLRLTAVELQDQSRYRCSTSTTGANKDSFINLKVDAPVGEVSIQQVENRITCSSEGIYPEPELSWSTNPPSNQTLQTKTTVQQTKQQLYNISSSLIVSETNVDYSCTVSTRRNKRRATLRKLPSVSGSSSETTILCSASNISLKNLVWRFNHSQVVLHRSGADVPYTASEEWRQQVKSVSESGDLTLKDLRDKHEGIYSCERSDDEETHVTNTPLKIERGSPSHATGVAVGVLVALVVLVTLVVVGFVFYRKFKKSQRGPHKTSEDEFRISPSVIRKTNKRFGESGEISARKGRGRKLTRNGRDL